MIDSQWIYHACILAHMAASDSLRLFIVVKRLPLMSVGKSDEKMMNPQEAHCNPIML